MIVRESDDHDPNATEQVDSPGLMVSGQPTEQAPEQPPTDFPCCEQVRPTPAVHATPRELPAPSALAVVDAVEALDRYPRDEEYATVWQDVDTVVEAVKDQGQKLAALAAFLDLCDQHGDGRVSTAAVREALR